MACPPQVVELEARLAEQTESAKERRTREVTPCPPPLPSQEFQSLMHEGQDRFGS